MFLVDDIGSAAAGAIADDEVDRLAEGVSATESGAIVIRDSVQVYRVAGSFDKVHAGGEFGKAVAGQDRTETNWQGGDHQDSIHPILEGGKHVGLRFFLGNFSPFRLA
jgi:hypothetical protein